MMLENVLHTQNMVVGRQNKFLRRLEVGFLSLKFFWIFDFSEPDFRVAMVAKNHFEREKTNFKSP